MIGIIGAMDIEINPIADMLENRKEETVSGIKYISGLLHGKEVVTAICGIGKVFAAICAQTMILKYSPDVIINTGVGGTLSGKLHIGDIALAEHLAQHDMDTVDLGDTPGYIRDLGLTHIPCDEKAVSIMEKCLIKAGVNYIKGTIASGDQFISDRAKKNSIIDTFDAIACEMEGASIGQVCYVNKTPFSVVRAISDEADGEAGMDFPTFAKTSAENSVRIVTEFVKEY